MQSLYILRHSALQILRQPVRVLQIFLLQCILSGAILKLSGLAFILSPIHMLSAINRGLMPWGSLAAVGVATALLWLWSALAWHRYILKEEYPSHPWPPLPGLADWRFFRTSFMVCLAGLALVFCASFALGFVIGFAAAATKQAPGWFAWTLGISLEILILLPILRLALNLPHAAIRAEGGAGLVWRATQQKFWTFLAVFLGLVAIRLAITYLLKMQGVSPFNTLGFSIIWSTEMLQSIFALSIVTTLYGHYVEGRPLV